MQCVFFVHLGPLFQGDVEAMNLDFVDLARRIHWYNSPNQILSMPSWFIGIPFSNVNIPETLIVISGACNQDENF